MALTMGILVVLALINPIEDPGYESGLTLRVWDVARPIEFLAEIGPDQTPNVDCKVDEVNFHNASGFRSPPDYFVAEVSGLIKITTPGEYIFSLSSDDGSQLQIENTLVIDHDGIHPAQAKQGSVRLVAGMHSILVRMFERDGEESLRLEWKTPQSQDFVLVPRDVFFTERGVTRVVSPGPKKYLDGRQNLRPGDGLVVSGVHPSWEVERLRPEGFEPSVGGMAFLEDGRLLLSTFTPNNNGVLRQATNGTLWILDGAVGGTWSDVTVEKIADDFHDPCGVVVVDGEIFVSHREGIDRLWDENGDGTYESREVFAQPWVGDNYHHFSFGLVEHEGWIYGTLSTAIYFNNTIKADRVEGSVVSMNGPNPPNRGTVYRIHSKSREVEIIAGGFRTPNGIGVSENGNIYVADNQGAWLPTSKLVHVQPEEFYGHYNGLASSKRYPEGGYRSRYDTNGESPPAIWLPQNEISNSPTTPLEIPDGPFAGQFFLGELTMGGIRRVQLEEVEGEVQGAVYRFTQGLECGVNRLLWGPDGCLYAGGTGSSGNWSWNGTRFGLQRLTPNGNTTFEIHSVHALPDGFSIAFTKPVDRAWLGNPDHFSFRQWRYHATAQYGGPKREEQRLVASEAIASDDGLSVRLKIPGLREGSVVHLRTDPQSVDGQALWSQEAWYTLNRIPAGPRAYEVDLQTLSALNTFEHGDARLETTFTSNSGKTPRLAFQSQYPLPQMLLDGDETEKHHIEAIFRAPRFDPEGRTLAPACLKEMRLNGKIVQSSVVYEPIDAGNRPPKPFGPLSREEDDGCTLSKLKLVVVDDEIEMPSVAGLRVLVFSKTQTFRHDSIPEGHVCLRRLAQQHGFQVTSTEESSMFNRRTLAEFDVVVFLNTTGDVLNDQQQAAFQSWYQSGGAFLGVHAASDTEHEWDWFGQLVGARFRCHPAVQPARLVVMDHGHPATAHLGPTWVRTDEWYDFQSEGPHEGCNCLLRVDENTYSGGRTGPWHPMAWSHEFDGGRSFYTALGHTKATFSEPAFEQHVLGGLAWVAGRPANSRPK